jgi:hypothetical protein
MNLSRLFETFSANAKIGPHKFYTEAEYWVLVTGCWIKNGARFEAQGVWLSAYAIGHLDSVL